MPSAAYQITPQVATAHLLSLAQTEFEEVFGSYNEEEIGLLAENILTKGHFSLQASDLAKNIFNAYLISGLGKWSFSSGSHHSPMPFFDQCQPMVKGFLGNLFSHIVGQALACCKKSVGSLPEERKDRFARISNDMPLEHFHLVRNPSQAEIRKAFSVSSQPANYLRASVAWESVKSLQQKAGNFHQDTVLFTVLYVVEGKMTNFLPINSTLAADNEGVPSFPKNCFNVWVGEGMAKILRNFGIPKKLAKSIVLQHKAPNIEPDPERIAFVASVRI